MTVNSKFKRFCKLKEYQNAIDILKSRTENDKNFEPLAQFINDKFKGVEISTKEILIYANKKFFFLAGITSTLFFCILYLLRFIKDRGNLVGLFFVFLIGGVYMFLIGIGKIHKKPYYGITDDYVWLGKRTNKIFWNDIIYADMNISQNSHGSIDGYFIILYTKQGLIHSIDTTHNNLSKEMIAFIVNHRLNFKVRKDNTLFFNKPCEVSKTNY